MTEKYTLHDEQGLYFMGEVKQLKKIIINRMKPSNRICNSSIKLLIIISKKQEIKTFFFFMNCLSDTD